MLFKDILESKGQTIMPEIERLFKVALKSQAHEGDLLLLLINGWHDKESAQFNNDSKKYSPYVIGPGGEGHSAQAHYKFIHQYRTSYIHDLDFAEYLKLFEYSPERTQAIDILTDKEEITVQLEMLIYLKIWEADLTIKKFYQLTRVLCKEDYDWHFKVSESSRDTNSSGTRQEVIRKLIRDKIKPISPIIHDTIQGAYKTQIRNSISHSNYSFLGRNIHPNNFVKSDRASQLKFLSFDTWIDMFHTTLMLHNTLIGLDNRIRQHYAKLAEQGKNLEVKIIEPATRQYTMQVEYRPEWKDFKWRQG